MTPSLTWTDVHARRLARGHLRARAPARALAAVVRDVDGIQAQLVPAAELSVSARVATTRARVDESLWKRRELVRTYGPRGTLHLLAAADLQLWLSARRSASGWRGREWFARNRLDRRRLERLLAAAAEALDGRALERAQLADEVASRVGEWARERLATSWADLVGVLTGEGAIVFGPPSPGGPTLVRTDQWLPDAAEVDGEQALLELLRRYLGTYGPATHGDFARWLGLAPARAKALLASLRNECVRVDVEGRRAWVLAGDERAGDGLPRPHVRLLAKYDAYQLGCRFGRERVVPDAARARLRAHPRGRYESAAGHWLLLVDGIVAGMWERQARAERVEVRVEPFVRLTRSARAALEEEAAHLGGFLGAEADLRVGPLPVAG
jgi:uncharacterized protein YcaQ